MKPRLSPENWEQGYEIALALWTVLMVLLRSLPPEARDKFRVELARTIEADIEPTAEGSDSTTPEEILSVRRNVQKIVKSFLEY